MVRTSVTVTLKSASIAARIWGFVASRCTRNAYSLRAAYAAEDFSVTTGPTIVDRKSTRLNSSHSQISYAVFCLKKKKTDAFPPPEDMTPNTHCERDYMYFS